MSDWGVFRSLDQWCHVIMFEHELLSGSLLFQGKRFGARMLMIGAQETAAQVQSGHCFSELVSILHFVHSSIVIMVIRISLLLLC